MWSVLVGEVLLASVAALLLYAGAGKIVQPSGVTETFGAMFPGVRVRPILGRIVGIGELLLALHVSTIRNDLSAALVLAFGFAVSAIGIYAIARGLNVPCNCFGVGGQAVIGRRQIAQLPAWLGIAWLITKSWAPKESLLDSLATFTAVVLLAAGFAIVRLWRLVTPLKRTERQKSVPMGVV